MLLKNMFFKRYIFKLGFFCEKIFTWWNGLKTRLLYIKSLIFIYWMPYSLKADTSAIIPKIQIMLCKFFFYNNSRFKTSTDNKHFMPHHMLGTPKNNRCIHMYVCMYVCLCVYIYIRARDRLCWRWTRTETLKPKPLTHIRARDRLCWRWTRTATTDIPCPTLALRTGLGFRV